MCITSKSFANNKQLKIASSKKYDTNYSFGGVEDNNVSVMSNVNDHSSLSPVSQKNGTYSLSKNNTIDNISFNLDKSKQLRKNPLKVQVINNFDLHRKAIK